MIWEEYAPIKLYWHLGREDNFLAGREQAERDALAVR
jgi:hypothetical protein